MLSNTIQTFSHGEFQISQTRNEKIAQREFLSESQSIVEVRSADDSLTAKAHGGADGLGPTSTDFSERREVVNRHRPVVTT
jgi:hypothetical protein